MTDQTLTNDAYERLKALNPAVQPSVIPRLRTMIPAAMIRLAQANARSSEAALLKESFPAVVAVDGVAPLDALIDAAEPLLIDGQMEVFLTGSAHPLEPVSDRETLMLESSEEFGFYVIEGRNIHVKEAGGEYGEYDGDVSIVGTRIPLSSTIPLQLQADAVNILVSGLIPNA
jgi:hypothetical protein